MRNFQCQESCGGKCCSANWDGHAGYLFLTQTDIERLKILLGEGYQRYMQVIEFENTRFTAARSKQVVLTLPGGKCAYLKEGKCTIYEARPTQCRTFPYWPELMVDTEWDETKVNCPGIGQGNSVGSGAKLKEQAKADAELRGGI